MKIKHFNFNILIIGGILAVFFLNPIVFPFVKTVIQSYTIILKMKQSAVYTPVGKTLALYCQSDQSLFPKHLDNAWLPSELNRLGDGWGIISANHAYIEMGGGFHHFGYRLELDESSSTPEINYWQLYLFQEGSADRHLQTISLPKSEHVSPTELLARVMSGIDELIHKNPKDQLVHQEKIQTYLRFDRIPEARQACKDMLQSMPDDWWAILINAFLLKEEVSFDQADNIIIQWVKKNENYFRYLSLAYFYYLNEKPCEAAKAIIRATDFDANTKCGEGGNSEFKGYTVAMCAYRVGDYDSVIRLCDHLLSSKINGKYAKAGIGRLKKAAEKAKEGQVGIVTWEVDISPFDAFENIDIVKLIGHNVPRPMKEKAP